MNILLIGYRGTGKTTVAQLLALRLGWSWIDTDAEIELAAGKSIREIFADQSEEVFRDRETQVLSQLSQRDEHVFALGGGAILRTENRELIRDIGQTVWLQAAAETLCSRISGDETTAERRPNLTADGGLTEIIDVLHRREPLYRECADIEVDTENMPPATVAEEILRRLSLSPPESPAPPESSTQ